MSAFPIVSLSESDLLSRMKNFEDHFIERKTVGDSKDWVKTIVAFANSAPTGYPCVLYIGAKDSGEIETKNYDFDAVQKTLNEKMHIVYPPIAYVPKVISDEKGTVLAVIVSGSEEAPHFAAPAYVRKGSQTVAASQALYDEFIALRSGKARKLLSMKGELVSVLNRDSAGNTTAWVSPAKILDCNQFWLTLESPPAATSIPLTRVELSFDHLNNRLQLELTR